MWGWEGEKTIQQYFMFQGRPEGQEKVAIPSFKERYTLDKRLKMVENSAKQLPDCVIVVIEKNAKCTKYPSFNANLFRVGMGKTVLSIKEELKQRINSVSPVKFDTECLFLYTEKRILNTGQKFDEIYNKYVDKEDGILYLKYSSIDPF